MERKQITFAESILIEAYEAYCQGYISLDDYLDTLCFVCELESEDC
jgi:hypothetical protein